MAGNKDFIEIVREIRGSGAPGSTYTDGMWYELMVATKNGNPGVYGDILAKYGVLEDKLGEIAAGLALINQAVDIIDVVLEESALKVPSGTTAARSMTPITGLLRFNTELNRMEMYDLDNWREVGGGQLLGTTDEKAIGYLAQSTGEELLVKTGTNAFSVDSITIEAGGSITVEDDAVYKVL